jgi:hypothetical protein
MTSLQKGFHANTKALPDVQYVGGPYYYTPGPNSVHALFPFSFQGGTLDIVYRNGFNATIAVPPVSAKGQSYTGLARRLGGLHLVQSIGPKFQTYIETAQWGSDPTFFAKHVEVYKPGLVTKVQQLSDQNLPSGVDPSNSYVVSANPPTTDFLVDSAGYGVTYAFEKPLVISVDAYKVSDNSYMGKRYITFYTSWDY